MFRISLVLIAVVTAVLLGAEPSATLAASGVCDPARTHASGNFNETVVSGGLTRDYILHVPASYDGATAVPLVLNFHGLGHSAEGQKALSAGLVAKADQEGFILVMPQGLPTAFLNQNHWNILLAPDAPLDDVNGTPVPREPQPDDLLFVNDLLDTLESDLCIDSGRVFATGPSNGAEMSSRLACSLSGRITAIAPVAGVYYPPLAPTSGDPFSLETPGCPGQTRPVPIIAFHGTADTIVPFNGGVGLLNLIFRDIDDEIMPEWAANNGCDTIPTETQVANAPFVVILIHYGNCDEDADVQLYVINLGGHWADFTIGTNTSWDLMWDFFLAAPPLLPANVTGDWVFAYSIGAPPYLGSCITVLLQAGAAINSTTTFDCEAGGFPSVTGGVLTAEMSGLSITGQVDFGSIEVNFSGDVSKDGDEQSGVWVQKNSSASGEYSGLRLISTSVSTTPSTVVIPPSSGSASGGSVTFDAVTEAGGTNVITGNPTSTVLPQNFDLYPTNTIYNVVTTATVTGNINVCINYEDADDDGFVDGTSPAIAETSLQLLHEEGGVFVDRTEASKNNYINNTICAIVSSLSEFALGAEMEPETPTPSITPTPTPPPAVGGIAADADAGVRPLRETSDTSGGLGLLTMAIALGSVIALGGAAWWTRRRIAS